MAASALWMLSRSQALDALPKGFENLPWVFLGQNPDEGDLLHRKFSSPPKAIGSELNSLAHEIKLPFANWISGIGHRFRNPIDWWASTIASKSPLQSDFFSLVCQSILVSRWAKSGESAVLVIGEPWLWETIRTLELAKPAQGDCLVFKRQRLAFSVRSILMEPISRIAVAGWCFLTRILCFLLSLNPIVPDGTVAIFTWAEPRSLPKHGGIEDPYTGRLAQILRSHGETVLRIMSLHAAPRLFARMAGKLDLATPAAFIGLSDFLHITSGRFRLPPNIEPFEGIDLSLLLKRQEYKERSHPAFAFHKVWHSTTLKMAEIAPKNLKAVIYPFENQPWEKLFVAAWRKNAPAVRLIAYQHSIIPPLQLNFLLPQGEIGFVPLPDAILTSGQLGFRRLNGGGFPLNLLSEGGALRQESPHAQFTPKPHGPCLLVGFPYARDYAQRLSNALAEALRSPIETPQGPLTVSLRFHPWLPADRMNCKFLLSLPAVSLNHGPVVPALEAADVVLFVPPTTLGWEALLRGKPVLKFETDLIDLDAAPPDQTSPFISCCSQNLRDSIARAFYKKIDTIPSTARELFGPVNERAWQNAVTTGRLG